jgi:hypothetical protein
MRNPDRKGLKNVSLIYPREIDRSARPQSADRADVQPLPFKFNIL